MDLSHLNIQNLLPQQFPFVMVDKLIFCDTIFTKTEFLVKEDNLFAHDGVLLESGLVENIAQTCAARMGYINSILRSGDVKVGFIGSIKNLNIYKQAKVLDLMETIIEVKNEVFNIILVDAKVMINNEIIADCEMKISEQ
jgi:predicted hotdog family 3-hydroxylacyl-ACP dehydratase